MPQEPDFDFPESKPYWQCQECGHQDKVKAMPKDRQMWYAMKASRKCPKCKSEAFCPVGW